MTPMIALRQQLKSWNTIALLVLAAWHWLLFLPVTLGQGVFAGGDVSSISYPTLLEYARALGEGRLPLWTPGMQAGFPLFAEGQIGALYPPNVILYRLLPVHLALSYSILLHLSWACVGMYLLCRSAGLRSAGAALAAIAFACSGFFLAHIQHLALLATAAWLPWLIYLHNHYCHARAEGRAARRVWIGVCAAVVMQLLSGSPQIALLNLVAFALISTFGLMHPNPPASSGRGAARNLAQTGTWIALGSALAAIQLLPTGELATWSARMVEGEEFFFSYSLDPIHLSQFISPFWSLGEPIPLSQEFWGYVGVVPLILALLAPLLRRNPRTAIVLVLALFALSCALGEANPVYRALYNVPLFNRLRVPSRFLFLSTFFLAYLAGVGLDELQSRARAAESVPADRTRHAAAHWSDLVFAFAVIGIAALRVSGIVDAWMNAWVWLSVVFLIAGIASCALALKRLLRANVLALLVIGVSAIELTLYAVPFLLSLDAVIPPSQFTAVPEVFRAMEAGSLYRVHTNAYYAPLRPNRPLAYGKQSAQANSPLYLWRNGEYLRAMSPAMMDLLNVRYVLHPRDEFAATTLTPPATKPLQVIGETIPIPPTRAAELEIVSCTENTLGLTDGSAVGDLILTVADNPPLVLPVRLGIETADWLSEIAPAQARHKKIANSIPFIGYSLAGNVRFTGSKYVYRYSIATPNPPLVTAVSARLHMPNIGLTIERAALLDESGASFPLATLVQHSDLALTYRDDLVALYENRNVLPRAFIVHGAPVKTGKVY